VWLQNKFGDTIVDFESSNGFVPSESKPVVRVTHWATEGDFEPLNWPGSELIPARVITKSKRKNAARKPRKGTHVPSKHESSIPPVQRTVGIARSIKDRWDSHISGSGSSPIIPMSTAAPHQTPVAPDSVTRATPDGVPKGMPSCMSCTGQ
jgi:hypothetical protein